jgi:hypothetical protein
MTTALRQEVDAVGSQWLDANGTPWRFSSITRRWQKYVGGQWVAGVPPTGGLDRVTSTTEPPPNVTVIEIPGPPGPTGPTGPPGPTGFQVAEVLPAQYQDGVNDTFPLSDPADLNQAVLVLRNGLMEVRGHGYLVNSDSVTFTTPPLDSDVLTVVYKKAQ